MLVEGTIEVHGAGLDELVSRGSVFSEMADVAYLPPHSPVTVPALIDSEIALGTAPARAATPPGWCAATRWPV